MNVSPPPSAPPESATIYRLLSGQAWSEALAGGAFAGSEHDLRDGFIHFSTAAQLAETAAKHYSGRRDLVLLRVPVAALGSALRWERSRGGQLFPHLYGVLETRLVTRVEPLALDAQGAHVLPLALE